ncbi:MAG: recombination mediator RecR [Pseudomonadota bacterium]|nr:recombination mediator RecR [Pseudomonadota bacterium]
MTPLLQKLIYEFQFLPGIGEKTAQRFVHYIFSRQQNKAESFANTLLEAIHKIQHCSVCRNLSEHDICSLCSASEREPSTICVVEHPSNVHIIESTGTYHGRYFVLHGALSPIDGIGPRDIGIDLLAQVVQNNDIKELIIATSSKIEGEATAYYIHEQFHSIVKTTRLAYGMPIGGSLDYIDGQTLARALHNRNQMDVS